MVDLVTLEYTKDLLNVDITDDDAKLQAYISASSASVINYLKGQAAVILNLDKQGQMPPGTVVPPEIQVATVLLVGHFYNEPDGDSDNAFAQGYLPKPVTALLYPLRDPALK